LSIQKVKIFYSFFLLISSFTYAQHEINASINISDDLRDWNIKQEIIYKNTTDKALDTIYLYNWLNAFSDKKSPLANRYAEEFVRKFHFASDEERGGTSIQSINIDSEKITWVRPDGHPDLIKLILPDLLYPDDQLQIKLDYNQRIPEARFTGYGYEENQLSARYWLIKPAVYDEDWMIYSHKNLDDLPRQQNEYKFQFTLPDQYDLTTSFQTLKQSEHSGQSTIYHVGGNHVDTKVYINDNSSFELIMTDYGNVETNLISNNLTPEIRALVIDRVMRFLNRNLGEYPFDKLVVADTDYKASPVYGLNQLPEFLRPFPDTFQYSIKFFKTAVRKYLDNTILINNRKDQWLINALEMSLMMDFVDINFSNTKLLGSVSRFPIINWSHAAELDFNDRYLFLWQTMARQNLDEAINAPQDSLLRFNQRITNTYKAGLGVKLLKDYTDEGQIETAIRNFYRSNKLKRTNSAVFKHHFQKATKKDLSWFFNGYIQMTHPVDFSISDAIKKDGSLKLTIKNKSDIALPVKLVQLKDNKVVSAQWLSPFKGETTVTIKHGAIDRVAINRDLLILENYMPNNFKAVNTLTRRPFQFRIFEDIDDQRYSQLFAIPEFNYNLYDGISIGNKFYNTSILPKNFSYKLSPKYGLKSNALVGSAAIDYRHFFNDSENQTFSTQFGANATRFSYNFDLFFRRFSGFINFVYRDDDNLRDNERHVFGIRSVNIDRDRDITNEVDEPDYNIVNLQYYYSDKGLDQYLTSFADYEIAQKFSKLSFTTSYRKLFENNRQINLRFFGGLFLYNEARDSDFFSFALDRPTDYLFDYNYYGRSEDSGLLSQQFILAEGGFKSQLDPAFANQWITTVNASTTIWNWIFLYGDAGWMKNKGKSAQFVYDSGIRLNFVEEYFELFLPLYSSKGFEPQLPNYDESVRFIVTLDFKTLLGLFKRKWY
jgi:hypothetical protein